MKRLWLKQCKYCFTFTLYQHWFDWLPLIFSEDLNSFFNSTFRLHHICHRLCGCRLWRTCKYCQQTQRSACLFCGWFGCCEENRGAAHYFCLRGCNCQWVTSRCVENSSREQEAKVFWNFRGEKGKKIAKRCCLPGRVTDEKVFVNLRCQGWANNLVSPSACPSVLMSGNTIAGKLKMEGMVTSLNCLLTTLAKYDPVNRTNDLSFRFSDDGQIWSCWEGVQHHTWSFSGAGIF